MPINQVPPGDTEIQKWFIDVPAVEPGVFEFALVLGGTVSAGAYTAGAVDFLVEALDCLSKAQHEGRAPQHKVRLKLIAGTSGGGVNAAIAARALAYEYPHVTRGTEIVLHLKKDAQKYLEAYEIERIVRAYSDNIQFPIELVPEEGEPRQINSASALWQRPKSQLTAEDYKAAYQSVSPTDHLQSESGLRSRSGSLSH